MEKLSEVIDSIIESSVKGYDNSYDLPENSFETLLSMGELVDRLSIVNFKYFCYCKT